MFIKKGISLPIEQFEMKVLESGPAQSCTTCGEELSMQDSQDGIISCPCGAQNKIGLENTNGK